MRWVLREVGAHASPGAIGRRTIVGDARTCFAAAMLTIQGVTVDCHNPLLLAEFWAEMLDWKLGGHGDEEVWIEPRNPDLVVSPDILFIRVPDEKVVKNRLHFDLRPDNQAVEVERALALGARKVDIGQTGEESWVVMADPEGNEFCILRPLS